MILIGVDKALEHLPCIQGHEHRKRSILPGDLEDSSYSGLGARMSHPKEGDRARFEAGQRRKRSNGEQADNTAVSELTRDDRAKRRKVMVENAAFEFGASVNIIARRNSL